MRCVRGRALPDQGELPGRRRPALARCRGRQPRSSCSAANGRVRGRVTGDTSRARKSSSRDRCPRGKEARRSTNLGLCDHTRHRGRSDGRYRCRDSRSRRASSRGPEHCRSEQKNRSASRRDRAIAETRSRTLPPSVDRRDRRSPTGALALSPWRALARTACAVFHGSRSDSGNYFP